MASFVKPFRHGDVVKYTSYPADEDDPLWRKGQNHIIDRVSRNGDSWEYSTNRGAWIAHECFTLVRECNAASINQLYKDIEE